MSGFDNTPKPNIANNINSNFGGILSAKPTAKYASGARTILKINGKVVGFAFSISWRIDTKVVEIPTIDDFFYAELVPQRITVDGSISALHIPGISAGTELWQSDAVNFLFQRYITIEVRDSATDQLLFYTNKAMITTRQEDIRVDQLANVQLSWKAIGFQDELKPESISQEVDKEPNKKAPSRIKGLF